jgi:hypothetical protein
MPAALTGHRDAGRRLGVAVIPMLLLCGAALGAPAQPASFALVIGESAYSAALALPACTLSARMVAASLERDGIAVTSVLDATDGAISAALGAFAQRLGSTPGSTAIVYACAYATADSGRNFLLPIETVLARSSDAATQGILARSLTAMPSRAGAASSLVVLDTAAWPGGAAPNWHAIATDPDPSGSSIVAATSGADTTSPTPLADALSTALAAHDPDAGAIAAALAQHLAGRPGLTIATRAGSAPAPLVPVRLAPAAAPPPPAPPPPPPPAPPAIPDEAATSSAQRQAIQTALQKLGYYDGAVDGIYGADTRAAIRRYQHELGHAMTGRLTQDEANALVRTAR